MTMPFLAPSWDPWEPAVQEILAAGVFLPLPGYDRHGRFVTLSRSGKVTRMPLLQPPDPSGQDEAGRPDPNQPDGHVRGQEGRAAGDY